MRLSLFVLFLILFGRSESDAQSNVQKMQISLKDTVYAKKIEPETGAANLQVLLKQYPDLSAWKSRKQCLKKGLLKAMNLFPMPEKTPLNPVFTGRTDLPDYSVENVAFECVPGVWVIGNLYSPSKKHGSCPAVLLAHGHFGKQESLDVCPRFLPEHQRLAASLARMGTIVFAYDMFAYGESAYHTGTSAHRTGLAQTIQTWSSLRAVDFLVSLKNVDASRIAMTGASGGGTQTFLAAALDERIAVSVPAVQVSCFFPGGCPCESGCPIHNQCTPASNNAEIAALAAPRPQLIISDGNDWTRTVHAVEYPYIRTIYGYYGKADQVENAYFPEEVHDYGYNKRCAAYRFLASRLNLDFKAICPDNVTVDESGCTILTSRELAVFPDKQLPAGALHSLEDIYNAFFPGEYTHAPLPVSRNKFIVIAHRGDHAENPENTPDAYRAAIKNGADYVEIDLRSSKDGQLVILHDATIDRMTDRSGKIKDLTGEEIRSLKVYDKKARNKKQSNVPTFEEVLKLCKGKINIYLDYKDADINQTLQLIDRYEMRKQIIVYVNSKEQYEEWREHAPDMPIIGSAPENINSKEELLAFLSQYPFTVLDNLQDQSLIAIAVENGVSVWLDVDNEAPDTWQKAIDKGIQGIQTDQLRVLKNYLKNSGK